MLFIDEVFFCKCFQEFWIRKKKPMYQTIVSHYRYSFFVYNLFHNQVKIIRIVFWYFLYNGIMT
jgi:hypothetical protein